MDRLIETLGGEAAVVARYSEPPLQGPTAMLVHAYQYVVEKNARMESNKQGSDL